MQRNQRAVSEEGTKNALKTEKKKKKTPSSLRAATAQTNDEEKERLRGVEVFGDADPRSLVFYGK